MVATPSSIKRRDLQPKAGELSPANGNEIPNADQCLVLVAFL
jgi:hypothetical protein